MLQRKKIDKIKAIKLM